MIINSTRNIKPAFHKLGLWGGMAYTGLFYVLGRTTMFQSPLNIKHKSCHLFTLNPQLFLEEVNADGFLVALGERAPTISGQSKFQTKEKNIEGATSGSCSTFPRLRCPRSAPVESSNETSARTPSLQAFRTPSLQAGGHLRHIKGDNLED